MERNIYNTKIDHQQASSHALSTGRDFKQKKSTTHTRPFAIGRNFFLQKNRPSKSTTHTLPFHATQCFHFAKQTDQQQATRHPTFPWGALLSKKDDQQQALLTHTFFFFVYFLNTKNDRHQIPHTHPFHREYFFSRKNKKDHHRTSCSPSPQ